MELSTIKMTIIRAAPPLARGSIVRKADAYPCFRSLPHAGSLLVSARFPSGLLGPESHGRSSQRRSNFVAESTDKSFRSSNSFRSYHCSSIDETFFKLRFGLRNGGISSAGGRRHGIRVPRSTENGGGEKGGGESTSTATEELEKEKDPNSSDASTTPSTLQPVRVSFVSHFCFLQLTIFGCDRLVSILSCVRGLTVYGRITFISFVLFFCYGYDQRVLKTIDLVTMLSCTLAV